MINRELSLVTAEDRPPAILSEVGWEDEKEDVGNGRDPGPDFHIRGDAIWSADGKMIANFTIRILREKVFIEGGDILQRLLLLGITKDGKLKDVWLSASEFAGPGLLKSVYEVQGGDAIIKGSAKELRIATQELSPRIRPTLYSHASNGFTADGTCYLTPPGFEISARGVEHLEVEEVKIAGAYGGRIRFDLAGHEDQVDLARHLVNDFLELKGHNVTFPLIAHVVLSCFASLIPSIMGKEKPALHLRGVSGGGKTFLASRAADFFGDFEGQLPSWSSTANALEALGYEAKDALFVVDDFKPGLTSETDLLRVLQNHANGQGRGRLRPNGRLASAPYIRGLLLSTGEGFVKDTESVAARTILIDVDAIHNQAVGERCRERRREYPRFLPGLIHHVLAQPDWAVNVRDFVDRYVQHFQKNLPCFPNNLRIASNWALNATGFAFFLNHLWALGAIPAHRCSEMASEYLQIVEGHIRAYAESMAAMNPAEVFRDIISQKLAAGTASVAGVEMILGMGGGLGNGEGKHIGKVTKEGLYFFPDVIMEILTRHFAARKTPMPFTEEALKMSLLHEGYLQRMESGRLTTQTRLRGHRAKAWKVRRDFLDIGPEDDE